VFGCGTTLDDEAIVKLASVFGTTAGLAALDGYRLHESLEIYRSLRLTGVVATAARSVVLVPWALAQCARQRKRWPWSDFQRHLETPLAALRAEYGIRVPHPGRA
jgi:hypothetical protein